MLSDEEWKAIKKVKYICDKWYDENLEIDVKWLESLLSICEKQQKEIEELKEDKEIIKRNYEDLVDENEKFLYDSAVYLMGIDDANAKWQDKIKAKIEFIKSLKEKIYYEENVISILQSLLEKE